MQTLLRLTTAYQLLSREAQEGRLANTYLLLFNDARNLRQALRLFAPLFFANADSRIEKESHPDCLFFPAPDKNLDKDGAAAILEESCLSPVEGKKKLFVIDTFHKANAVVQNKLLKVLEEPPQGVHFLLGATTEFPLLATVKSRAKKLEIPPFSEEQVGACLKRMYPTRNDIAPYAAISDGVLGRAQNLMEGGGYTALYERAYDCVTAKREDIPMVSRALNGVSEKSELIALIKRIYRDMLFYLTGQAYVKTEERIKQAAKNFTPAVLIFALDAFSEAEKQLAFNANLSQCVEVALGKIEKEKQKCKK